MSTNPEALPRAVYRTEQVRALDRAAIETHQIPGFELMSRAGRAALDSVSRRWPDARSLLIYTGAGNNAGDGYVVAKLALEQGHRVRVISVGDPAALGGDAATAYGRACEADVEILPLADATSAEPFAADLLIDAVLGTGLKRDLSGPFATAVEAINSARRPVLALDVPSGLDADTGLARGSAVRADATITFVGLKTGLFLGAGPDYCGDLIFSGLGIPAAAYKSVQRELTRLDRVDLGPLLERRPRTSHKNLNGKVLLVGGSPGMSGAIRLAAEAALRAGAGLVRVVTHPDSAVAVMSGRPEIMCRGVRTLDDCADWLDSADVLVLGPGLGQGEWGRTLFAALVDTQLPLVLDADGLTLLADRPRSRKNWVLTPHPGEAARLLRRTTQQIQANRIDAVRDIAAKFGAATVLKGACSLIAEPEARDGLRASVCDYGNPGMATAGTGDVLAGILGALLAQALVRRDARHIPPGAAIGRAACAAVLVHALAGDDAAVDGERGMLAGDLMAHIRRWVNPTGD